MCFTNQQDFKFLIPRSQDFIFKDWSFYYAYNYFFCIFEIDKWVSVKVYVQALAIYDKCDWYEKSYEEIFIVYDDRLSRGSFT